MSKVLTPEAEADREEFDREYDGGNCSCHISPPCGSCTHPGNPHNQDEYEDCWMDEPEPLPTNTRILISRNKREGRYGGKAWASEVVKDLSNDVMIWRRQYVRHARYQGDCFSLRYRGKRKWQGDPLDYLEAGYKGPK